MKIIKKNSKSHQYECPECKSVIEINDSEFKVAKEYPPFPTHLMGLRDFQEDTRVKVRVCDCPVCGGTIRKEYNLYVKEGLL